MCGLRSVVAESWFARALNLERKRTERSGTPFLLVLLEIDGVAESNGGQKQLVRDVLSALRTLTRETDVTGWYHENSVLGLICTEIGTRKQSQVCVDSVRSKIVAALDDRLGKEKSGRIAISCHVYPDDWKGKGPEGKIGLHCYPDLENRSKAQWLRSTGKRMTDIAGSLLALILVSPLLVLIAIIVRLTSSGPVLFRQKRVGQFGEQFTFLKFRSMVVSNNSEIHKDYVKKLISGDPGVSENGVYKIQNDPRVTAVGRFLRKTSLDELPQFWNVLMGQMSLVGPRPALPYEVEAYDIWHRRRLLEAKPGITGLWQVNGRNRISFDDMVRLDLRYIRFGSFWLDLKILLKTPRAVLAGAY